MRKHTIYDIADASGYSAATVSRALNHPEQVRSETRQSIQKIAEEMNFSKRSYKETFHRQVPEYKSKNMLVNLPSLRNPFYGEIVEGANSAASRHGCHLLIDTFNITEFNVDSFLFLLDSLQISGVILMRSMSESLLLKLRKEIPIIQCSEYNASVPDVSYVSIDDVSAEYQATKYALSTNHIKIAFLTINLNYHFAQRRMNGFLMAAEQASLKIPSRFIIQIPQFDFNMAYNAALKLLSASERPDAIIAISDIFAAACIKAAAFLHIRVPEDLIVIGFDNIDIANTTYPSITTIDQPQYQLGYTAFEVLLSEAESPKLSKQQIFLPAELIIRQSTAMLK